MNKTFNKMYHLGCFKFNTAHTCFSFLVFVFWKINAEGKKKGRVVVDIRKLNKIVLPNFYLLPPQSKIITNVQGYINFVILDAISFFYQ